MYILRSPGSARSEWMSNSDRPAEHVGALGREIKLALDSEPLGRKRLQNVNLLYGEDPVRVPQARHSPR